jgi:hypothetical protein
MIKIKVGELVDYCFTKQENLRYFQKILGGFFLFFSVLTCVYSQSIGINTTGATPNSKTLLDIDSDNITGEKKGLLIPRMTTSDRNTLSAGGTISESLIIYNTSNQCFEAWNQSAASWIAFGCLNCHLPGAFNATTVVNVTQVQFTATWSASAGATGYYLDVSTNSTFSSFVGSFSSLSVGNVVTSIVSGLTPNTTYFYRVRAVNACGTTINSNVISVTTLSTPAGCVTSQLEANYNTVITSLSGSTRTWITRNLGATAEASSVTSIANNEAGCYFQFNRSQAYGFDNGGSVYPTWTITSINQNSNWLVANDPCRLQLGGAWRLPTSTEWTNVIATGGWNNRADAYASVLKLHVAGLLNITDGALLARGSGGYFHSSTQINNTEGSFLRSLNASCIVSNIDKPFGLSVRCLK